jgi:hypothetical protein
MDTNLVAISTEAGLWYTVLNVPNAESKLQERENIPRNSSGVALLGLVRVTVVKIESNDNTETIEDIFYALFYSFPARR